MTKQELDEIVEEFRSKTEKSLTLTDALDPQTIESLTHALTASYRSGVLLGFGLGVLYDGV